MSNLHLPPKPTLGDIQNYVRALEQERGFTDGTLLQSCLLLTEEIGELAKCVRKSHAGLGMDTSKQYELDAAGEIADIIIVLTSIANRLEIDMETAFRAKEEANKKRTWN